MMELPGFDFTTEGICRGLFYGILLLLMARGAGIIAGIFFRSFIEIVFPEWIESQKKKAEETKPC
jgi:hypothetical protein